MRQQDDGQKKSSARQQGLQPAANDRMPPETLKMQTLARLGLWKEPAPPPSDDQDATMKRIAVWQRQVMEIQSLAQKGKQGDAGAIKQIESFLGNKYVEVWVAAIRALAELSRVVPIAPRDFFYPLAKVIPSEVRVAEIMALIVTGTRPAGGQLDEYLEQVQNEQEEQTVRIAIIQLLGTLGRNVSQEALVGLLETDPDWLIREAVVNALVALRNSTDAQGKRSLNKNLTKALYDDDAFVREAAVMALRESFPLKTILSDLHGADAGKREKAARALGAAGQVTSAVVEGLAKHATGDAMPAVRKAAVLALANLDAHVDEATLMTLLKDRDEEVHAAALILEDMQSLLDDEQGGGKEKS